MSQSVTTLESLVRLYRAQMAKAAELRRIHGSAAEPTRRQLRAADLTAREAREIFGVDVDDEEV